MWKLSIWPVICVSLLWWNYSSEQQILANVGSCGMFDCAFLYLGIGLFHEMIIGSLIFYTLFVLTLYLFAKIKKQPMNYLLPVIVGPISAPLVVLVGMIFAN